MRNDRLMMTIILLTGFVFPLSCVGQEKTKESKPQDKPGATKNDSPKKRADEATLLFDGKTLAGWKTPDKFEFEKHGKVQVSKGELQLGIGKPSTGIVYSKKLPRNNYELSLEVKRTDGSDFFCGLTFPVDKEYCTMIIGGWGGGVVGLSNVDANSAVENETTSYQEFKTGKWYSVRVRVTDERIEAWIDKKQVIDLTREGRKFSVWWEQEPMRPLGVANWHTASARRHITLRAVKPQGQAGKPKGKTGDKKTK